MRELQVACQYMQRENGGWQDETVPADFTSQDQTRLVDQSAVERNTQDCLTIRKTAAFHAKMAE